MPNTGMVARDVLAFASGLPSFYNALYGTPAADVVIKLGESLTNAMTYTVEDEPEDELLQAQELPEGGYQISLTASNPVPEEVLKNSGVDQVVNDAINTLQDGIQKGTYKEGTIQRAMVDDIINKLEKFQRRELVVDTSANKIEGQFFPGSELFNKYANYNIVPKHNSIPVNSIPDNFNDEEVKNTAQSGFPENFPQDDATYFRRAREDYKQYAKYTMEELQAAADKIKYDELMENCSQYLQGVGEFYNTYSQQDPASEEQEKILRDHALTGINNVKNTVNKIVDSVPKNDTVAVRFFGGQADQLKDYLSEDRGIQADAHKLDTFEAYLKSGLPLAGFAEYQEMKEVFDNIKFDTKRYAEYTTNGADFIAASVKLAEKFDVLPPEGSTKETCDQWCREMKTEMQSWLNEYQKFKDNIQFVEKEFPAVTEKDPVLKAKAEEDRNREIKSFENTKKQLKESLTLTTGGYYQRAERISKDFINDIDHLGQRSINQKRARLTESMKDAVNSMNAASKECAKLKSDAWFLSGRMKNAMDQVIQAGDVNYAQSPEKFAKALSDLKKEAQIAGRTEITNWVNKNEAYFSNRVRDLKSKGCMTDESLNLQLRTAERQGRDSLQEALNQFNTRRSRIFGKGSAEYGKESDEHKTLREAAQKLVEEKAKFKRLDAAKDSREYEKAAAEYMKLAENVSKLAAEYMKKKDYYANTGAGKERYNGALTLYTEAQMERCATRKILEGNKRYKDLAQKTIQLQAGAFHQAQAQANNQGGIVGGKQQVNDINFNDMLIKNGMVENNKPKFQGRKQPGPNADKVMQGDQNQNQMGSMKGPGSF